MVGGNAALGAAKAVRDRALELAPEDLVLAEGTVHVKGAPQMAVTLAALARAADPINTLASGSEPGLRAADYFRSPEGAFASGVHGAVVAVDSAAGMVGIEKYVVVHDCGVMINPTIVEGQYGARHRRRLLREAALRRAGPAADDDLHGLPDPDGHGDPAHRDSPHGEPFEPQPARRQGRGQGRAP